MYLDKYHEIQKAQERSDQRCGHEWAVEGEDSGHLCKLDRGHDGPHSCYCKAATP